MKKIMREKKQLSYQDAAVQVELCLIVRETQRGDRKSRMMKLMSLKREHHFCKAHVLTFTEIWL